MWQKFGTDFIYIHTGILEYMNGGTTLSMHKLGSGLSDILDPEIDDFMKSKEYYELCVKYGLADVCFLTIISLMDLGSLIMTHSPILSLQMSCQVVPVVQQGTVNVHNKSSLSNAI